MRILILITTLVLLSCGQNKSEKKEISKDTTVIPVVQKDSITKTEPQSYTAPGETSVNESLSKKFGNKWHVMNDRDAKWIKDAFDYFIVPKRKEIPDYPYITKGDFNDDGKEDTATVVTDANKKEFRIAILLSAGKPQLWEEDVLVNAALSTIPKGEAVEGGDPEHPKKFKMKADAINVEYFEQASFVLYSSGTVFKRIQTGD